MTETLYLLWPDVPVVFRDCTSKDQMVRYCIRRAAETADDNCLTFDEMAELVYEKLQVIPEFVDLIKL
jgi:hypothetical protein